MLDTVIRWSLDNGVLTLAAAGLLLGGGVYTAATLPVDVFPDLTTPTVTVLTEAHGMAPEEVETLVTFRVETAVNGASGVRRVRSSSAQGISIVWVEFDWGADIFRARQIVSEKLQLVARQLPPGVDPPLMAPVTSIMGEILLIGMTSPQHDAMEIRTAADWVVRPRLLAIPGVAQVAPIGGDVLQYQVLVDPFRLAAHGVSLGDVVRTASAASAVASGGVYQVEGQEVLIRGIGRVRTSDDLGATVVTTRGAAIVRLRDVADVRVGPKPKIGTASVRAEPAVVLSVQKQPAANTLALTAAIDDAMDELSSGALPEGIAIDRAIFRQADFIALAVDNVIAALRDGAVLVVLVLFAFLWNVRTTGISVLAIPLSLSAAVLALKAFGITINTMTLGGMAIAVGALVDDAIIDVENIFRRLKESRHSAAPRRRAVAVVYDAAREVRAPIVNATLIIVVVFVPLFFLSGVEGRMLRPLGFAYIVSILASLGVAVTVTPVLSYYLLPGAPAVVRERDSWLVEHLRAGYGRMLESVLERPRPVLAAALVLVLLTVALFPRLGRGFLPEFQEGTLTVSAVTAPGTGLAESDRMGRLIEEKILAHPAVVSTARRTGRAELDEHAQGVNAAEIDVGLDIELGQQPVVAEDLRRTLSLVPGTNVTIGQPIGHRIDHMLSGTRAAIAVKIFGPDLHELRRLAEQVRASMEPVEGVVDLAVEQQADVPQLQILLNRASLAGYGVTPGTVAEAVDIALNGEVVSQVHEGQRTFDLVVRLDSASRVGPSAIRRLPVDVPSGTRVPLELLADIREDRGPNTVSRENVQRLIVVQANVAGRDVGSTVNEIRERVGKDVQVPTGYLVDYGGQFESGERATRTIALLSILSVGAVFLILLKEFGSARIASLVMVNLPLALVGGLAAAWLAGGVLNVATLVGFVTLFGIAVRNGILLVSHYHHLLDEGLGIREAVTRGSLERLNPILMTALTAALALIPLALGGGEPGKEIQAPMAVVVLGGLLSSTALNMVVVPVLFLRYGQVRAQRAGVDGQ